MIFTSYASGSTGNFYTANDSHTNLIIDCGIPIAKIKEKLKFKLHSIDACLLSHSHADHSLAAADLAKAGIDVYASPETLNTCGLRGHRFHIIDALRQFSLGSWNIMPFNTVHDTPGSLGFLFESTATKEKLLYITDSAYSPYKFKGLSIIAIECNYDKESLNHSIRQGFVPEIVAKRLSGTHMELGTLIDLLRANDLSKVKQIYLMHMSRNNSNAARFKTEIQKATGAEVYICG